MPSSSRRNFTNDGKLLILEMRSTDMSAIISLPEYDSERQFRLCPVFETIFGNTGFPAPFLIIGPPATCTFPSVEVFIKSGREEDVILTAPSKKYLEKLSPAERKKAKPVKVRIVSPDGTESVLLTNLSDKNEFPAGEIIALYFRRWEVEGYCRDEKTVSEVEKFHSQTANGILQELFALMIMSVISRTLMILSSELSCQRAYEPQFKNAVMTLASEAAVLVPDNPEKATEIFNDILSEIARVKYYRPKIPRPSQPRVCKRPLNKWGDNKLKKIK